MSAAGSRAEVTAALKHAAETDKKELKRFSLMFSLRLHTRNKKKQKKRSGALESRRVEAAGCI